MQTQIFSNTCTIAGLQCSEGGTVGGEQRVTYRYREFCWYRNWHRSNLVRENSLGTGIGKNWY